MTCVGDILDEIERCEYIQENLRSKMNEAFSTPNASSIIDDLTIEISTRDAQKISKIIDERISYLKKMEIKERK